MYDRPKYVLSIIYDFHKVILIAHNALLFDRAVNVSRYFC